MNKTKQIFSEPSSSSYYGFIPVALVLVVSFAAYIIGGYIANTKEPVQQHIIDKRLETLKEVNATQDNLINSYHVINKAEGVYGIPVQKAIELTLQNLNKASQSN